MEDRLGTATIALPPIVNLDALDGVRDSLLDAIESGPVTVSAEAVERVATNGLLLLISAAATAHQNGSPFTISGASAPMLAAIERLGFGDQFAPLMRG